MLGQTRSKVYIADGTADTIAGVDTSNRLKVDIAGASTGPLDVTLVADTSQNSDLEGGGKISVGTTAVEVTFSGTPTSAIIIRADRNNTGLLYIGKSDVTNAGANAFTYLEPGDSAAIEYDDADNPVFVVSDVASQNFWKGALV